MVCYVHRRYGVSSLHSDFTIHMPKDKKSKIGGTKSKNTQPSVHVSEPSLAALQQLQESGKKANLHSRQTRRNYAGYVKRGRDWLAGHFSGEDSSSVPKGVDKQELSPLLNDVYQDPDFKNAFNERPNRYTHQALALFISYKCFHQNLKAGTGTRIHAFQWLTLWIWCLESEHYSRPLDPEDYIFPSMGANGVVQPQEHVSHDTIQSWINEATTGAEIRQASGGSF